MNNVNNRLELGNAGEMIAETVFKSLGAEFRSELAFPADAILYTLGDHPVDLCVVLEGERNIILPSAEGEPRSMFANANITSPEKSTSLPLRERWSKREPWFQARCSAYHAYNSGV
jgi:hypothetical protein